MLALAGALGLAACATDPPVLRRFPAPPPVQQDGVFVMPDGARLPYRNWLPPGRPDAVMLALHGMNDSRDAWEIPAPELTATGIAVFAPDQRGFGLAPERGRWPGADALAADAGAMACDLARRFPGTKLFLAGESMGGAVLMHLATSRWAPPVDGYVLIAPAVWGRASMNMFLRSGLWLLSNLLPGAEATHAPGIRIRASDNTPALIRLSTDPLTIHATRFDTLRGLVDLMDLALAASRSFAARGLFLYGGQDRLVPPEAMLACWRGLPPGPVSRNLGFYPGGYHLLMRDLERAPRIADVAAWVHGGGRGLTSGADQAARSWLMAEA